MNISKLHIINFRSYHNQQFTFKKGVNVLVGDNGVGKTNVVEAIHYLSLARSFRGTDDKDLIKKETELAEINATVNQGDIVKQIKILITKNGRKVFINGKPINKISELSNAVNVIVFEPKDVMMFRGLPKVRRNFIDISLSKKSPVYLEYISRYEKLLKKRNDILKSDNVNITLLEANTELLIQTSETIVNYRVAYMKDINDILNKITRALAHEDIKIDVIYKPYITPNQNFYQDAKNAYKRALESDLRNKATTIGIHREDFYINLNGREIGTFGSQGENRLVALALKLTPYFLIEDEDKKPIVVLDDVMSELDTPHQKRLLEFIQKFDQVFITTTKLINDNVNSYQIK
jgi:DNA replication and repair protein RecF